jgi:poly-gamma-glutamate synthesis protein (capsule biosynthesis protein)
MKKLILLLCAIIAPLIFFSFLASTGNMKRSDVTVFFANDVDMQKQSVIAGKLASVLEDLGYRTTVEAFDRGQINSYLFSNPDALFVTQDTIDSDLFVLQQAEYLDIRVPVSSRDARIDDVEASVLGDILQESDYDDRSTLKNVRRNRVEMGVVSLDNLSLEVKMLSVNGVSPTLKAVANGSYPWKYHAYVYGRSDNQLIAQDMFRERIYIDLDKAFTLVAGGDIMLSRGTGRYIDEHGPEYPFEKIRDIIQDHDIAFANLESPISSRGRRFYPNKGIYFRADPSVIEGLLFSGFDVFSLGNNHSLDWGAMALQDTIGLLNENGFSFSGAGATWQEAFRPAVFEVEGSTVAIISINDIYPFVVGQDERQTMMTLTYDSNTLQREIRKIEKNYDIIIASVHAGIEYIGEPEPVKVEMMRNLIDYGVDVVIGHHPHVIQGIEAYGNGLIAYSLGNLIFDQAWSRETSLGLLLEICFYKDRPIYYYPRIVFIDDSQARVIDNEESKSIISTLSMEISGYEYVKN